ncbi:MAG: HDOD domain-containing protein [Planctomycetota bacterium]|nr:HDOD domain-containing protein [Planctomycetota bacterium]
MIDVQTLIQEARELQPLQQSSIRLAQLFSQEDWFLSEITEVIRLDEALAGRLIGAANSALSGSREPIKTVDHAVMRVGTGSVLSLALAASIQEDMQQAIPQYGLSEGQLWKHSVAAALAVEEAAPFCRRKVPSEAYAAALLHDIGKLVLARHIPPGLFDKLREAGNDDPTAGIDAEAAALEVHHAGIGGVVASNWGLPDPIAVGVTYHHNPLEAPTEEGRRLCNLVGMADAVAHAIGVGCGTGSPIPEFSPAQAERLGMTGLGFEGLCAAVESRLEDVLKLYD